MNYVSNVIRFLFLKNEYRIVFPSVLLVKFFKILYFGGLGLFLFFRFLVFCWDGITGGYSLAGTYINFFIFLFLLYPLYKLFRFLISSFVFEIRFSDLIYRDLKNFLIGNRFVDEKIDYVPDVRFSFDDYFLIVKFRLDGHIVTKKFGELGEQLSSMFVLSLDSSEQRQGYYIYKFRRIDLVRDDVSSIVNSDTLNFVRDSIVLNDSYSWNFRKCPHGLISGITGSGKTFLFAYFIIVLLKFKAIVKIIDPKRADLAYLEKYFGKDVVYEKNHALRILRESCELIDIRMDGFKNMESYKWGEDYSYYNVSPYFVIFDEAAAFSALLDSKDKKEYDKYVSKIILEGRQAGIFIIFAMQRPDVDFLPGALRDQLGLRIALGSMSNDGYRMVFGSGNSKDLILSDKTAGFYMDMKMDRPKEFYTPYLDIDFIQELEKLINYKKVDISKAE